MKSILTMLLVLLASCIASGQQNAQAFPRTISVTGSAEMEVYPDEIFINITLREYQKKGESKKNLEELKNNFLAMCRQAGVPDSLISIANYEGYNGSYLARRNTKKSTDLMASITYQIRFSSGRQIDDLTEKLDDEATQAFQVVRLSHSNITEFRRTLKIRAVKAAKDKAVYLAQAIDEQIGPAITITEPTEYGFGRGFFNSNEQVSAGGQTDPSEVNYKKLKLRFEVTTVFALK